MIDAAPSDLSTLPVLNFLPPDIRQGVASRFVRTAYTFGQTIVTEGAPADALYILTAGRARMVKLGENGDEVSVGALKAGDTFGESGLLEGGTHPATVRASSDVEVLRLERSVLDSLLAGRPEVREYLELQARRRNLQHFLRQFSTLSRLPAEAMAELLRALEPVDVGAGETVFREGDPPGPLYIIEEGRCRLHVGVDGRRRNVAFLRKGEFFGEQSVFRDQPREGTIEAVTPARLLRLTRETYADLLRRYPEFREEIDGRLAQYDFRHTAQIPIDLFQELLPAEARAQELVGDDQVDHDLTRAWAVPAAPPAEGAEPEAEAAAQAAPFADEAGRFVKRERRIRRFPHLFQIDEMDCGATSLAIVCRHFGKAISLARIRQLVHTGLDGASLRAICEGANELGLAARAVKASPDNLDDIPLPAVVHWDGNHWVVLYGVEGNHVRVSDPGVGKRRVPRQVFLEKWTGYAALFDYTDAFERNEETSLGIAWFLPFFRPHYRYLLQAAALAIIVSALQMAIPVFTQVIVDRVLVERDLSLLHVLIVGMTGLVGFTMLATLVQRYLLSWTAVRIDASSLDFLTRRLLSLPMSYFTARRTGDIQRRLAGIWQIREIMVEHGVASLTAVAQLFAALALMVVYSPTLALVFLSTTPLLILLMRFASSRLLPLYAELEESHGRYQSFQIDAIKGIETVKSLGAEHAFRDLMLRQFHGVARKRFRADYTLMGYQGVVHTVTLLSVILFLLVGAQQVMQGNLSIGALVAFNALVALANQPIMTLLTMWDNVQLARVYLNRLDDIFQQEPEQGADHTHLTPVKSLEGRITFRHVGFRYGGPEAAPILEDLTFEVPPNTKVAIVGRSGSGKTTLIKCLAGLLEPTAGTILYDGIDLKNLNYRDLRRKIGFVLQENHLFDDSIARNIAFGEEEPDVDRVMWAAQVANSREFIERLPFGYDTRIGESGIALSGGQRQRIAIARAVYPRPPVLIFDEATSALDTESERAVKENMDQLLEGRTSFVIAHRLSTVRDADLILVLEHGRLVEQGTHDDLMERQGLYYFLVSQQLSL
ncbi:MAG TPA: peptidase domain-containing ABC transporter [Gemmatimonadales bacterium]|nr:peptidase domain-containing ABC transporter [Gemmatimonadales bacterium]